MRYLVLSDMHANAIAFEAVLAACPPDSFDQVLVLGDLVGYGARPNEVVDLVTGLPDGTAVIRGNHDKVVTGIDSDEFFNPAARMAVRWTTDAMTEERLSYVRELVQGPLAVTEELVICHGTPHDEDAYVLSAEEALGSFASTDARLILFGHTHVTCVFALGEEEIEMRWGLQDGDSIEFEPEKRYLINPGSVGQPRDGNPKASCLTLDLDAGRATWHRVEYAIEEAQRQILKADLPHFLAERLGSGL